MNSLNRGVIGGALFMTGALTTSACQLALPTAHEAAASGQQAPPAVDFQHGDLVLGVLAFNPCGRGRPNTAFGWQLDRLPSGDPVLVDLYYVRQSPEEPFPHFSPEDAQGVVDAGGEIVHAFNMGVVRTRIPREALANFQRVEYEPTTARVVPDPSRTDVAVWIGAGDPGAVQEAFVERGGVITREANQQGAFAGVISDDTIPSLRALATVRYVEHAMMPECLL